MTTSPDFVGVTEIAGDPASAEQIRRMATRYYWAAGFVKGLDVLELGCGAGQGLGYLARFANRVVGADVSAPLVAGARRHYGDRIDLRVFDAQEIPFPNASFDVVLLFEAIYYIPDVERFAREVRRVLRGSGRLLLATANKDLFDFTPSPHSIAYYGVRELGEILDRHGFDASFYGDTPIESVSSWQRALRPIKQMATKTGLMPKSKMMKALVKRMVFGEMKPLPAEIVPGMAPVPELKSLTPGIADTGHKVLLVEANRR